MKFQLSCMFLRFIFQLQTDVTYFALMWIGISVLNRVHISEEESFYVLTNLPHVVLN